MRRKISALVLAAGIFCACLTGCRNFILDDNRRADKTFLALLSAVESKDSEALKSIFSQRALANADDIDAGIAHLFALFQGTVQTWGGGLPIVSDLWNNGKNTRQYAVCYTVWTDVDCYSFFLLDYPLHSSKDAVGLYTLRVLRTEDEEKEALFLEEKIILGIYRPTE